MKLAFLIPNLYGGGTEKIVAVLSEKFTEKGIDTSIIALEKGKDYEINKKVNHEILTNYDVKKDGLLKKIIYFPMQLLNFTKFIKNNEIDTVLSFLERANFINILSKFVCKHKAICNSRMILTEGYLKEGNLIKRQVILSGVRFINKFPDLIICNSKGIKRDLVKNFKINTDKIKIISNPCDIEKIREMAKEPIPDEFVNLFKNTVIINVGRLTRHKGQWHLIRAFSLVKNKIKDAKLIILGEGDLHNYLKNLIVSMNLTNEVFLAGFQQNPFNFIANSKVFVLSSIVEGFPNALLEAMACGIPTVSFDCKSGPREILEPEMDLDFQFQDIKYGKYGVLIPAPDGKNPTLPPFIKGGLRGDSHFIKGGMGDLIHQEKLLSSAIINILKNKELSEKYSELSLQRAKDFELEKIIDKYYEVVNIISD